MATSDLHIVGKTPFAAKIDFPWKGSFVMLMVPIWTWPCIRTRTIVFWNLNWSSKVLIRCVVLIGTASN